VSWVLAFAGFAVLIICHELGHFTAAKAVGMRVERFALFFPPLIWKVKRGETEYGIGAIPLGGYVRITGMNPNEEIPKEVEHRAYYKQKVWKRIVVIGAGPAVNIVIALAIWFFLFWANGESHPGTKVTQIGQGSPAAAVLQDGDRIVSIDGKTGAASTDRDTKARNDIAAFTDQLQTHKCAGAQKEGCVAATPATVVVVRDGQLKTISVAPRYDAAAGRMRLGFSFGGSTTPLGPVQSLGHSADFGWTVATTSVTGIAKLFYDEKARENVSGVVGSYETTRQAINFDATTALNVLAIISLSLAIINLFPFLPLDGGHIFWALAEKVRGRPISFRVMERASVVGFMLVIFLFAIGLTNDIGRLQGAGFQIR
jgi:regulator of sigma E protease